MRTFTRNNRPRRTPMLAASAILAFASAVSCSHSDPNPSPATDSSSTTITWYASAIDRNQNDYRQVLINEFRNAHPSIRVNLVSQPPNTDVIREELVDAIPTEHAPDVYLGDVIWPAEFAEAGLARPLDDDFEPAFWQRFPAELLSAMKYHGKTYAVPFFASQGMLYYRTDLVQAPPTTWEQLVQDAANLLRENRVTYGFVWQGAAYEGLTCDWTEFLADAGGRTLNDAGTESQIDSLEAHRALTFIRSLIEDGITPPEVTSFHESDAAQLFMSGQVAFMRSWNSAFTRMNTPSSTIYNHVGVVPLPTFAGQSGPGYSTIGGWSLYINPNSRNLEAAQTFIDWLTDTQAQLIISRFSHIPTNAQVRKDPAARQNPAVAVGLDVKPIARPSSTPVYPAVSKIIFTTLNDTLDGEPSVDDALRDADRQLDAELH